MAGRKIRSAADARVCLAAAEAARDMSRAEWAREHGIDARSLNVWRVNLGRRGTAAATVQRGRLVELIPALGSAEASVRYVVRCGELAMEVDERFDEATLSRLLRVVTAC